LPLPIAKARVGGECTTGQGNKSKWVLQAVGPEI
jgi:hypothetical protein